MTTTLGCAYRRKRADVGNAEGKQQPPFPIPPLPDEAPNLRRCGGVSGPAEYLGGTAASRLFRWCAILLLSCAAPLSAAQGVDCSAEALGAVQDRQKGMKFANALKAKMFDLKTLSEPEKLRAYAEAFEAWRLLGRAETYQQMGVLAAAGIALRRGAAGLARDEALGKRLTDQAKLAAKYSIDQYRYRTGMAFTQPVKPVMPAWLQDNPPVHALLWARETGGFQWTDADQEILDRRRYCELLARVRGGASPGGEESWAIAYETQATGHTGTDLPPGWKAALAAGHEALARAEAARKEQARREAEAQSRMAQQREREAMRRKRADTLAEQARRDVSLFHSDLDLLCDYHADLCQRQLMIMRYSNCMSDASQRAGTEYAGAVRMGGRPSDGSWSGTFRQLQASYERECQSLKPPGYYR